MKTSFLFLLFLLSQACSSQNSIFELSPNQSMSITGKGPGQDAAFNPHSKTKSVGVIESLGPNEFTIRIQNNGEIIEQTQIYPDDVKEVILEIGNELYLDSKLKSKAKVTFKEYDNGVED